MRFRLAVILVALSCATPSRAAVVPNDPDFPVAWHAHKIGLPDAWDVSTGSASTIVAILDTGVIANQPDFGGRVLPPLSTTGSPAMDGTVNHHGTYVAGTAAMQINNGVGSVGVGNFSILPITVTDEMGFNSSDWIADGIRLAADRGARVINVSLSTLSYGRLDNAAAYARSKGALTFVAAGNSNVRSAMSGHDNLIFVSGTDRNDGRWTEGGGVGSSWGPYVDLSAPAHDIRVIAPSLEQGYGWISGTSFASPLAAGAAALAFSINPELTPAEVQAMLYDTAVDLGDPGWDEIYGHGRIHVAAVAHAAAVTVPEPGATILTSTLVAAALLRRRRAA